MPGRAVKQYIGPRNGVAGHGGHGWTRVIGRDLYWFRVTPDGARCSVMRIGHGTLRVREFVHWLYAPGVDRAEYEAAIDRRGA